MLKLQTIMRKIHFRNKGQNLSWLVINDNFNVVDSSHDKKIWCGDRQCSIYAERLKVGQPLWVGYWKSIGKGNEEKYVIENSGLLVSKIERMLSPAHRAGES
jgi:hypothetical protein